MNEIRQALWPSYWMILPIALGTCELFLSLIVISQSDLKRKNFAIATAHIGTGIVLGMISVLIIRQLEPSAIVALWAIVAPIVILLVLWTVQAIIAVIWEWAFERQDS